MVDLHQDCVRLLLSEVEGPLVHLRGDQSTRAPEDLVLPVAEADQMPSIKITFQRDLIEQEEV